MGVLNLLKREAWERQRVAAVNAGSDSLPTGMFLGVLYRTSLTICVRDIHIVPLFSYGSYNMLVLSIDDSSAFVLWCLDRPLCFHPLISSTSCRHVINST